MSSKDRALRSLVALQSSASTARTLNLVSVWRRHKDSEGYRTNPFFHNAILNRSIIVKHRLRQDEDNALIAGRAQATKIIFPIDISDLRSGGQSVLVGQRGYRSMMEALQGQDEAALLHDMELLDVIDRLPSLDPYLMRERLKRSGFNPDRSYFELTEADNTKIFNFARDELVPLIGASFDSNDARLKQKTGRLAEKLLSNAGDAELDPLRMSLGIEKSDFEEGVFSWRGFIYYKWCLLNLIPRLKTVGGEIASIKPIDKVLDHEKAYMDQARYRLSRLIADSASTVKMSLRIYEDAYADLTRNGQPQSFRTFLLKAPAMFYELGARLGGMDHIVSFWRYRFPEGGKPKVTAEELLDIFADFEGSLSFSEGPRGEQKPYPHPVIVALPIA